MRRRRTLAAILLLILVAVALAGAGLWWYLNPAPGPLRLTKVSFADLPGWATSDTGAALAAFRRSCAVLSAQDASQPMGGASYAGTAGDWHAPCAAAGAAGNPRAFFERWFTPVEATAGRVKEGRFTGYYEPELNASRTQHGRYRSPVYDRPDDLVTVDLGQFRPALHGERIAGRVENGRLIPYASRAEIDAKGLAHARVLFFADDPVTLFFLHVQGSGRVRFDDGSTARVSYAAQNGQLYTAIGKTLIARGLPREGLSLQVIRSWLKSHPSEAREVMETDASYVFFMLDPIGDPGLGAKGAEGVPLTPRASLAVDPRLHALGTPVFVAGEGALGRLFVAQDIGGAIRGPVRGDLYFGFGGKAEADAGTMNQMGRMFVLLPKPVAERLAPQTDYPETAP